MSTNLRRGHGNSYRQTHPQIAPAPTAWMRRCGKCSTLRSPSAMKKHKVYGFVCADGCRR